MHQVGAGHGRRNAGDLVQRERRYKGRRGFVHQVGAGHGRKNAGDLVQRKRRYKGRRDFVHQDGAGHGRKNAGDLVQRKRRYKGWRDFVHQVAPRATPAPRPRHARTTPAPRPAPHHARTTPGAPPRPPARTTLAHTEVYKLPHDNKSVLKGNFFCGIILSPERNQRCNTGNNMKGDAI